jgi:membrane protein implicated in regulation of membrane protease activity
MPLSDHEQRILEEIEKRLREEDPRLAETVAKASVHAHIVRRVRLGIVAFVAGFILLMLFMVSLWVALAGFGVMLASALFVYHTIRRMAQDQVEAASREGGPSVIGSLARLVDRFRGRTAPPDDQA